MDRLLVENARLVRRVPGDDRVFEQLQDARRSHVQNPVARVVSDFTNGHHVAIADRRRTKRATCVEHASNEFQRVGENLFQVGTICGVQPAF